MGDRDYVTVVKPHVGWKDTPAALIYEARFPGAEVEDMSVQVEEGKVLHIILMLDEKAMRFCWKFSLPETANVEETQATLANEILTVTVPKFRSIRRPKKVKMNIISIAGPEPPVWVSKPGFHLFRPR